MVSAVCVPGARADSVAWNLPFTLQTVMSDMLYYDSPCSEETCSWETCSKGKLAIFPLF